jgi:pimeloyl-ACP methyl ester carboxylesterase
MHHKLLTTFGITAIALTTASFAHASEGEDLFIDDVELRPGVMADVHLSVYQNTHVPCRSGTVFAIHGANSTALSLEPFALELTQTPVDGRPVCRVVTMDLPGHGQSPPPSGALFGELTLDDYATAVVDVLGRLPAQGIRPRTIVGHSMGGMVIQLAQQALVDDGSSLWDAFHIGHAVLLSPAIPAAVPWTFRDDPEGPALISMFLQQDPVLGPIIDFPPEVFVSVVFTTLEGILASNAMTPEEVAATGWMNPESLAASGPLLGLPSYDAPEVDSGIFADELGTQLDLVAFEQDTVILATDLGPLFSYLSGKPVGPGFATVTGEIATHGLPQSDPAFMVDSLKGTVDFP